jgi:hypothetical protein
MIALSGPRVFRDRVNPASCCRKPSGLELLLFAELDARAALSRAKRRSMFAVLSK